VLVFLIPFFLKEPAISAYQDKNTQKVIKEAEQLISETKLQSAIKKLKKVVKKDKKCAEEYYLLGEAYRQRGTLGDRLDAEKAFQRALKLEPQNTRYLLSYGILRVAQGYKSDAEKTLKKVIDLDSTCANAYYWLSLLEYEDLLKYRGMVSREGARVGMSLTKFGLDAGRKSKHYIKKSLFYDNNAESYYLLGLLFKEDRNWKMMIESLEKALNINPEDKKAVLFLGYAYQQLGEFSTAEEIYENSKSLMSMEEVKAVESVEMFLSKNERKDYAFTGGAGADIFWKQRDPSFLSRYNERKIEHYSRFAYANLIYGNPVKGLNGWNTDRGEIFLRYGEPLRKIKIRPEVKIPGSGGPGIPEGRGISLLAEKEIWSYRGFSLAFEDRWLNGNFTLDDYSRKTFETVKSGTLESYLSEFDRKKISFSHMFSTSRGDDKKTILDVFFEIPVDTRIVNNLYGTSQVFIKRGLFIFDTLWNEISRNIGSERFYLDKDNYSMPFTSAVTGIRTVLDAGLYNMAGEFQDWKNVFTGSFRERARIPDYSSRDSLMMSDLILGIKVDESIEDFSHDLKFFPQPSLIFVKEKPVELYFEIYNLIIRKENKTSFRLNTNLTLIPGKRNIFGNLLKKAKDLISRNRRKVSQTNIFDFQGNSRTEKIYLTFQVNDMMPGKYLFTIELEENFSGKTVKKSREIIIL